MTPEQLEQLKSIPSCSICGMSMLHAIQQGHSGPFYLCSDGNRYWRFNKQETCVKCGADLQEHKGDSKQR